MEKRKKKGKELSQMQRMKPREESRKSKPILPQILLIFLESMPTDLQKDNILHCSSLQTLFPNGIINYQIFPFKEKKN